MPVKRINYTNRRKLTREEVRFSVHPDGNGSAYFEAELHLGKLRPDADSARVFVEAYHLTSRMRFDFGAVAALTPPPLADRRLTEFPHWKDVKFRVKVTDVIDEPGKLLAWANQVKPRMPGDEPEDDLVRFRVADLDGRVWDIEFDDEGPIVLVDIKAGGVQLGLDNRFRALVYPEILRRTLTKIVVEDRDRGAEEGTWHHRWIARFVGPRLGVVQAPPDVESDGYEPCRDWIDQAVRAFGSRHRFHELWNPPGSVENA